mgnify:CR=1 FL=1
MTCVTIQDIRVKSCLALADEGLTGYECKDLWEFPDIRIFLAGRLL